MKKLLCCLAFVLLPICSSMAQLHEVCDCINRFQDSIIVAYRESLFEQSFVDSVDGVRKITVNNGKPTNLVNGDCDTIGFDDLVFYAIRGFSFKSDECSADFFTANYYLEDVILSELDSISRQKPRPNDAEVWAFDYVKKKVYGIRGTEHPSIVAFFDDSVFLLAAELKYANRVDCLFRHPCSWFDNETIPYYNVIFALKDGVCYLIMDDCWQAPYICPLKQYVEYVTSRITDY